MSDVFIVSAVRTAIGRFLGTLQPLRAPQLGAAAVAEAVHRAGIGPESIDEVIIGNVLGAGLGQNPARQAAIFAGIPNTVGAVTINKVCGSGMKAVMLAAQTIRAGDAECIVAGGMESMSNAPYLMPQARTGARLGHVTLEDAMIRDGLWDVYNDFHMGNTAELVAEKYGITRREQDEYACRSHQKAVASQKAGRFNIEIVPVEIKAKKGGEATTFTSDEGPREDASVDTLSTLKPAFKRDGTVTPGNASMISDGASAVVVASEAFVKRNNLSPLVRITGYAVGGCEPQWVMLAPIYAVENLLEKTKRKIQDFDLFEINEAFSAGAICLERELKIPPERVNVNGGSVALGHPIGATGTRILTTLIHAMRARGTKTGLASLCLGGGNAVAMGVERV